MFLCRRGSCTATDASSCWALARQRRWHCGVPDHPRLGRRAVSDAAAGVRRRTSIRRPAGSLVPRDFELAFDLALLAPHGIALLFALHASRRSRLALSPVVRGAVASYGDRCCSSRCSTTSRSSLMSAGARRAAIRGRAGGGRRLVILLLAHAACFSRFTLHCSRPRPAALVRLVGALVGQPSVWPYVRIAQLSPVAGARDGRIARLGFVPVRAQADRFLTTGCSRCLAVWAPVFALGAFAWNVPPRYTEMSLAPMLLCAFAASQHAVD